MQMFRKTALPPMKQHFQGILATQWIETGGTSEPFLKAYYNEEDAPADSKEEAAAIKKLIELYKQQD
jgi:hypothetical protein